MEEVSNPQIVVKGRTGSTGVLLRMVIARSLAIGFRRAGLGLISGMLGVRAGVCFLLRVRLWHL